MNNQSNQALKEDKTVQDHAYDLLGELLLQKETQLMLVEIENEKNTEAEREMNDFFAQHEPHHLRIIEKNSRNGKDRSHLKRQIARAMQIAAVLIVCLTVAGVTAVAGSSHLRVQIMQLLARTEPVGRKGNRDSERVAGNILSLGCSGEISHFLHGQQ